MMPVSHHVTETKPKNRRAIETKDTCFCEESLIKDHL